MTRVLFLGTAGALPTEDRANTCLAVLGDTPGSNLLIDCGGGVYRSLLRAGIGPDSLNDLFITHAHIDHIGSLPSLIESFRLSGRQRPLRIYAIPEVLAVAESILQVFNYELTLDNWAYEVTLHAVEPGQPLTLVGVDAQIARMDHTVPSAGLRLDFPTGALAYTCDTQPNPAIAELGKDARLFIAECTFLGKDETHARASRHMTALEAGQQAAQCGVDTLALVHLGVAEGWTPADARSEAAQAFNGAIVVPQDGDALEM